jgi:hypothetical protein
VFARRRISLHLNPHVQIIREMLRSQLSFPQHDSNFALIYSFFVPIFNSKTNTCMRSLVNIKACKYIDETVWRNDVEQGSNQCPILIQC